MKKYLLIIMLLATQANAQNFCGSVEQGGLIIKDGELIAFDRDAKPTKEYDIKAIKWDIQDIKGVPQKTVTPNEADQAAIAKEAKAVKKAFNKKVSKKHWHQGFIKPLEGRISGKYGGQRIYNGVKKNAHLGVDIARPTGTEVVASGAGVVVGAIEDGFYNGNLVIINHGDGLKTVYGHLNKMLVKVGDEVKAGDVIAHVGSTGRSTGPHLHFGANLNGIKFNPDKLYDINKCLTQDNI